MKRLKFAVPGAILIAGLASTNISFGKAEYSKKEKKACAFCHVDIKKPKELNDAGKYYAAHDHSLEGYQPATQ